MRTIGTIAILAALAASFALAAFGTYEHVLSDRAVVAHLELDQTERARPANDREYSEVQPLIDDSLAAGTCWKALCPTVDGGVDADVLKNVDGGAIATVTDWTIQDNHATISIRAGLDSAVDGTHGLRVTAGNLLPMHARKGRCQSEGAAVVADVCGGRP